MNPFFSIVVPVFNQIGNMELCIESLRSQTFDDFEVIFVDDASTDGSWEYLRRLETENARFRIVRHEKNSSVLAARYTGMREARGEYLLFVDSDDSISADACRILYEKIQEEAADILFFGAVMLPSAAVIPAQSLVEPLKACLEGRYYPSVWKNCYSKKVIRKALEKSEPFCCNIGEDSYMTCVLFCCADTYARVEEILYYYIEGQGISSVSSNSPEKTVRDLQYADAAGEHIVAFIREHLPEYSYIAEKKAENILRYVLFQHVYYEEDWSIAIECLKPFNDEKHRKIFEYGCRKLLPAKVKRSLGIKLTEDELL